ncbi:MAG TPA: phosphodiester glycosidase family protein [Candidatus Gastranaerophilales bacterium]|nr:phosphodiester glycosidase family protein [Candidatus Gastranaerophilales bacterium]
MGKKFVFKLIYTGLVSVLICLMSTEKSVVFGQSVSAENKDMTICFNNLEFEQIETPLKGIAHKKVKRWLNGKPAIVNIITVNPQLGDVVIKATYGEYYLHNVKKVKDFAAAENAIAAINASFFKPDIGVPLGVSIIDGEIMTGPVYNRVVLGIDEKNEFLMEKPDISGEVIIGENLILSLYNFNQPVYSGFGCTIFTDRWGEKTPHTSTDYCHIVIANGKIQLVKQSSVAIPDNGYVIVAPRWLIKDRMNHDDAVSYSMRMAPEGWSTVKYAVGGGPFLVRNGKIFIDDQKFTDKFLWTKEPRTAIGYSEAGTLILVTVDGRKKGVSEGATITELAHLMWELGAYNAMNLDGGSSTQMVYKGELVNMPTVKGGGKVTNALVITPAYKK